MLCYVYHSVSVLMLLLNGKVILHKLPLDKRIICVMFYIYDCKSQPLV
jgi:hypothetical protein